MMKVKVVVIVENVMQNGILELLHVIGRYTSMVESMKYCVQTTKSVEKVSEIHRMVCLHARSYYILHTTTNLTTYVSP